MNSTIKLLICSCTVLAFGVINLHLSPIYNGKVDFWNLYNCDVLSDQIKELKTKSEIPQSLIEKEEAELTECIIKKSFYTIEKAVFIINIGIGFICALLGLFGLEKETSKKSGMLGLALGIIGAILTFIYVIFNGIVYTNYYDKTIYKINENGAFAESSYDDKYKCLYFNKENDDKALIAKFSDLIKSRYNYNKEMSKTFSDSKEKSGCNLQKNPYNCQTDGFIQGPVYYYTEEGEKKCYNLYYYNSREDNSNYDISSRFLAALIFSLFIVLGYCAMTFFGFMVLKVSSI